MQDVFGQCGKPKKLPMRSKKRACKLIVCDLDGTLLDEQKQMDLKFLRVMQEKKIPFTFATGRNYHIVKDLIEACNIHLPYITNNGANIFVEDTCIYSQNIDKDELQETLERLVLNGISFVLYSQDEILSWDHDVRLDRFKQRLIGKRILRDLENVEQSRQYDIFKVVMVGEDLNPLCEMINSQCKDTLACCSENQIYTITHRLATKGKALRRLLQLVKIDPKDVIVFGDNYNDVSMFAIVQESVAMVHSDEKVKSQVKHITDRVSKFIDENL